MLLARLREKFTRPKFTIVESPYAGDVEINIAYAQWAVYDAVSRNESPYASHLLLTQVLYDDKPAQRELGLKCALAVEGPRVYYVDRCAFVSRHRTTPTAVRQAWEEQREQCAWDLLRDAAFGAVHALGLALCVAFAIGFARRGVQLEQTGTVLAGVALIAAAGHWAERLCRVTVRAHHRWTLMQSKRVLTPGMLRAFSKHPGELRFLKRDMLQYAALGIGPVADRMTWGGTIASTAYVSHLREIKLGGARGDE